MIDKLSLTVILALFVTGCAKDSAPSKGAKSSESEPALETDSLETDSMTDAHEPDSGSGSELATFAAGCFWCVEAVFEQLDGVSEVNSGYMGGTLPDPTYEQVCTGETGHAEVVQVRFDPRRIAYETLLEWFWKLHDPTTLNRQGNDVGTQYRSAIFHHSEEQRLAAEASRQEVDASGEFSAPIVTEITAADRFYPAEDDHQEYYRLNKRQPYCRSIIAPKLKKLGLDE